MSKKLIPEPFMNKGSKGPGVVVLGLIMKAAGYDTNDMVVPGHHYYGDAVANAVTKFQTRFDIEVDGNCGPETRAKIKDETGIDLDKLCVEPFVGETVCVVPESE